MTNISNNLNVHLCRYLEYIMSKTNTLYFIVGATARDIIFNTYDVPTNRATLDTDIAVFVENWEKYFVLKNEMMQDGQFKQDRKNACRLNSDTYGAIDLIAFGDIEADAQVSYPPEYQTSMNMLGFKEAYKYSLKVDLISNTIFQ